MKQKGESGFNLVELMVVVSIIGILSAVAVPRFQTFKARAIQTEAKAGLNGIYLAMNSYEANYGVFPVIVAAVGNAESSNFGFALTGNMAKYSYNVRSLVGGWVAIAESQTTIANALYDTQRINTNKWLCSPYDAVSKKSATLANSVTIGAIDECPQVRNAANAASTGMLAVYIAASDAK